MAQDARDTTRLRRDGTHVPNQRRRKSQGGVDVEADLDLAGVLTRLTSDLEQFEAAISLEMEQLEHPMTVEQTDRHSQCITSNNTLPVAEVLQILILSRLGGE